jgi:hypothetical protein
MNSYMIMIHVLTIWWVVCLPLWSCIINKRAGRILVEWCVCEGGTTQSINLLRWFTQKITLYRIKTNERRHWNFPIIKIFPTCGEVQLSICKHRVVVIYIIITLMLHNRNYVTLCASTIGQSYKNHYSRHRLYYNSHFYL